MTAGFDWAGAPDGERWIRDDTRYVVQGNKAFWWTNRYWEPSALRLDIIRTGTRVESVRPPVRVGDRVRVTVEGVVRSIDRDQIDYTDDQGVAGFVSRHQSAAVVEVLVPADPPLEPGDLVRSERGLIYIYAPPSVARIDAPFRVLIDGDGRQAPEGLRNYRRSEIPGPLVKVELREVSGG